MENDSTLEFFETIDSTLEFFETSYFLFVGRGFIFKNRQTAKRQKRQNSFAGETAKRQKRQTANGKFFSLKINLIFLFKTAIQ